MVMLSDELKQAAQALGEALRATDVVQTYLDAQARLEADPEVAALQEHLLGVYHDLVTRQQAGESLSYLELNGFYTLRKRVQSHPRIAEHDAALKQVKSYFAGVGIDLSIELGLDYPALATRTEEDDSNQQ